MRLLSVHRTSLVIGALAPRVRAGLTTALLGTLLIAPLVFCAGTVLSGFASATGRAETHQYIVRQAFARLQKDAAYRANAFPSLDQILAFEGVSIGTLGAIVGGEGPDARAPYSWHYYNPVNPVTQKGLAPAKAKEYFEVLRRAGLQAGSLPDGGENPAKAAAYLAHIIADLSSPYHVAGQSRDELRKPGGGNETILLDYAVVGPGSPFINDWADSVASFFKDPTEPDWFDPWYWNGRTVLFGTHAWLEASIWADSLLWSANARPGYSPLLLKMLPALVQLDGSAVARFAEQRAMATWQDTEPLKRSAAKAWYDWDNGLRIAPRTLAELLVIPPKAPTYEGSEQYANLVEQAIQDVYTVWRASLCALQPQVDVELASPGGPARFGAVVTVANLEDTEWAAGVSIEMEAQGARLIGPPVYSLREPIAPGKKLAVKDVWKVEPVASQYRLLVRVKGGTFSETPDAGEAWARKVITMPAAEVTEKAGETLGKDESPWDPWRDLWFYSGTASIKATRYYLHKRTEVDNKGNAVHSSEERATLTCESSGVVKVTLDRTGLISGVFRSTTGAYPSLYELGAPGGITTESGYRCAQIETNSPPRDYLPYGRSFDVAKKGDPGEALDVMSQTLDRDKTRIGVGIRDDRVVYLRGEKEVLQKEKSEGAVQVQGEVDGAKVSVRAEDVRRGGGFRLVLRISNSMAGGAPIYRELAAGQYDMTHMSGSFSSGTDYRVDAATYSGGGTVLYDVALNLGRIRPSRPWSPVVPR